MLHLGDIQGLKFLNIPNIEIVSTVTGDHLGSGLWLKVG